MATTNNQGAGAQGNTDTGGNQGDAAAATAAAATAAKATADAAAAAAAASAEAGQAGKDAEAAAAAAAAAAATKAPEKYELKVPEKSTLDAIDVAAIETIARENNWTNEQAQAALERHNETLIEQSTRFADLTNADKDYGGANLATTQARAKAAIDFIRPEKHPRAQAFRALIEKSGYGNHIEIVSFLADLGKRLEEDGAVGGDGGGDGAAKTDAEMLYGKA